MKKGKPKYSLTDREKNVARAVKEDVTSALKSLWIIFYTGEPRELTPAEKHIHLALNDIDEMIKS